MHHPQNPPLLAVTRAVVWNQTLWTAGYSLTSGGFLYFFARRFGAGGFLLALLMATPETVGPAALLARSAIERIGSRRQLWIVTSIAARAVALGIPLMAVPALRPATIDPLWIMADCLAAAHALQHVAYAAILSWLSDLVPEQRWGRVFAIQSIAQRCVLLVIPVAAGYARDMWSELSPETESFAYVIVFAAGTLLQTASLAPLWRFPDASASTLPRPLPDWRLVADAWRNRPLRFLLIHNWWLAFFNGLTQSVFFLYATNVLGVGLARQNALNAVMSLTMIPAGWLAGVLCDRSRERPVLAVSLAFASGGLVFWIASAPQTWWLLIFAYVLWGAFAAANVSGQNLLLKLAPRSDNTVEIVLFRQVGGLLAGVSGILGGLWLDQLLDAGTAFQTHSASAAAPYRVIMLVSLVGRLAALPWLLAIQDPAPRPESTVQTAVA